MHFEIVGEVAEVETIASGRGIKTLAQLRKRYGGRRWRKLKGVATVRLTSGRVRRAEVHLVRSSRRWAQRLEDQAIP